MNSQNVAHLLQCLLHPCHVGATLVVCTVISNSQLGIIRAAGACSFARDTLSARISLSEANCLLAADMEAVVKCQYQQVGAFRMQQRTGVQHRRCAAQAKGVLVTPAGSKCQNMS